VRERTADCLGQGERESGQEGGRELRDTRREASGETMWRGRPRAATMLPGADAIPISFCPNISERTVKGLGFRVSADAMPMSFCPNIYLFPTRTVRAPVLAATAPLCRAHCPGRLPGHGQIARPTVAARLRVANEHSARFAHRARRCKCPDGANAPTEPARLVTQQTPLPLVSPSPAQLKSRSCAWYARACVKAEPAPHGDPSSPYRNVNALW
jgi:hypothetical protein